MTLEKAFPEEIKFISENRYMDYDPKYGTFQLTEL